MLAYFLSKTISIKNTVLIVFSLLFYAWGEPVYLFLMLGTIFADYLFGLAIEKTRGGKYGRLVLALGVAVNLSSLVVFKYAGFLLGMVNALLGTEFAVSLSMPIGISFYTFQTMSYVIDVYRGKVKAQRDLLAFATYVTLFPQLIAGPIVRYSDVAVQLKDRRSNTVQIAEGVQRFAVGFAKKVLLANQVYIIWKEISAMDAPSASAAWLGAIAFTFQIYFDFSGYSDMAIGLGKIFGFDYLENFNYPYISKSITEFWRRWHMSLSSWFKEYVYVPLGGNRKGLPRQLLNIAIVWALTGLWHGASWNFVAWGVYFGVILIIEKLFLLRILEKAPAFFSHLYALVLIVCGWVIFAIEDLGQVGTYFSMMFGASGHLTDDAFWYYLTSRIWLLAACIIGSTRLPAKISALVRDKLSGREILLGAVESAGFLVLMVFSIAFLVSGSYNPFLYFRF